MSKYEINKGIYKTWIVNNYFQYFIKRKERKEVTEWKCVFMYRMTPYNVREDRPFMSLDTMYLLSKSKLPYRTTAMKSVCRDMVNELILRN